MNPVDLSKGSRNYTSHHYSQSSLFGIPGLQQTFQRIFSRNSKNPNISNENAKMEIIQNEFKLISDIDNNYLEPFTSISINHERQEAILKRSYVNGTSLAELIMEKGPQSVPFTIQLSKMIVTAMEYCHDNSIVMQTLKPSNVIVINNSLKIVDFGISLILDDTLVENSLISYLMRGPEGLTNSMQRTKMLDVFHFGLLLYVVVAGCFPWKTINQGLILKQLMSNSVPIPENVNSDLAQIISDCLRAEPEERPTASQLKKRFQELSNFIPIPRLISPNGSPKKTKVLSHSSIKCLGFQLSSRQRLKSNTPHGASIKTMKSFSIPIGNNSLVSMTAGKFSNQKSINPSNSTSVFPKISSPRE